MLSGPMRRGFGRGILRFTPDADVGARGVPLVFNAHHPGNAPRRQPAVGLSPMRRNQRRNIIAQRQVVAAGRGGYYAKRLSNTFRASSAAPRYGRPKLGGPATAAGNTLTWIASGRLSLSFAKRVPLPVHNPRRATMLEAPRRGGRETRRLLRDRGLASNSVRSGHQLKYATAGGASSSVLCRTVQVAGGIADQVCGRVR